MTPKQRLRKDIDTRLDDMSAAMLQTVLDAIEMDLNGYTNNYRHLAMNKLVNHALSITSQPMSPQFKDGLEEALSALPTPEETKGAKRRARVSRLIYSEDEVGAWLQQFVFAYRTGIYYHEPNGEPARCKLCDSMTLTEIVMLNVGLQAGPFCRKCLRRIPRSWYCQD